MSVSATLIASYLYCPRKIFLERVLGFFEPPKAALVKGSIKHETFELINYIEKDIVKSISSNLDLREISYLYRNEYSRILRKVIIKNKKKLESFDIIPKDFFNESIKIFNHEAEMRSYNVKRFIDENQVFGEELWEKLSPKIHSEVKIFSDSIGLRGIVDCIEVYENKDKISYVPVELKSGKAPKEEAWPGHKVQLGVYAILIEDKYKTKVKEGFVYYLDSQEKRHIPINIFLKDEVLELKAKVDSLLNSDKLPDFCEQKRKCEKCGLRNDCYNEKKLRKTILKLKSSRIKE